MVLPPLSPEERHDALRRAGEARRVRAEVKDKLRARELSIEEVLTLAVGNDIVAKLRVIDLLQTLPGVGEVRARQLMDQIGISPSRRLRGLGTKQSAALIAEVARRG